MNRVWGIGLALAMALPLSAASGRDDAEDVKNAAKKLGEAENYSWTSTPKSEGGGGGGRGRGMQAGPVEGKTEKDGYTTLATKVGEQEVQAVLKGSAAAIKSADGWKAASEFGRGGGGGGGGGGRPQFDPASMFARTLRNFKAPAADAAALVDKLSGVKKTDDAYEGELTEEGAKSLLQVGGRGGGGGGRGPTIDSAAGTVKFWVTDGVLTKYEVTLTGKMTFGDREIDINRTTTVEIKDVGSTKVEVDDEAKAKLSE